MTPIKVTFADIKEIKRLIDANDQIKEDNYQVDGYSWNYQGKEAIIDANEKKIEKNISIISDLLKVSYNVVIYMVYDFDHANYVLTDIYKN